jgi:hypothetical protein
LQRAKPFTAVKELLSAAMLRRFSSRSTSFKSGTLSFWNSVGFLSKKKQKRRRIARTQKLRALAPGISKPGGYFHDSP